MGGSVVSTSQRVSYLVSELLFNDLRPVSKNFIQDRSGHRSESVATHFFFIDFHAPQGREDGVVTHGAVPAASAWEDVIPTPSEGVHGAQNLECLSRERNDMLCLGFGDGIAPLGCL